jgi:hypothetical protein
MIFRGYFDESYDKDIFTLCCSLSDPVGWGEIERGWKNCLRAKNKSLRNQGRPGLSRYHASHANARDHEFEGWGKEERDELAIQLLATLSRGRAWLTTVSWSLPLREVIGKLNIEDDPLPFCYSESLKFIMLEMVAQLNDAKTKLKQVKPLKYVLFHERCSYDEDYLRGFNRMMNDPTFSGKELFSTIAPLGWEDCIALQPADVIAYEAFKDALRMFNNKNRRPSLECLLQSRKFGGRAKQMKPENVEEWRDILQNPKGV